MSRCHSQHRLRYVNNRSNQLSLLTHTLVSNSNKLTVPFRKNLQITNTFFCPSTSRQKTSHFISAVPALPSHLGTVCFCFVVQGTGGSAEFST